jgi:hypothetical protein
MKRNIRPAKSSHDSTTGNGADVPITNRDPEQTRLEPAHPVLQAVAAHLRRHKLKYAVTAPADALVFNMSTDQLSWTTLIYVLEDKPVLCFRGRLPLLAPPTRRGPAAALLTKLNYGNLLGLWQMDPDDGEILFSVSHLLGEQPPTEEQIKAFMGVGINALGDEGPEILRLIHRPSRRRKTPLDPSRN